MCLAIPGQIVSITESQPDVRPRTQPGFSLDSQTDPLDGDLYRTGKVSFGGVTKTISLAYVPEATVGDYVIVHVGFAISILDQAEALQALQDLNQLEVMSS